MAIDVAELDDQKRSAVERMGGCAPGVMRFMDDILEGHRGSVNFFIFVESLTFFAAVALVVLKKSYDVLPVRDDPVLGDDGACLLPPQDAKNDNGLQDLSDEELKKLKVRRSAARGVRFITIPRTALGQIRPQEERDKLDENVGSGFETTAKTDAPKL